MAWKSYLFGSATYSDFWAAVQVFMIEIGWELHDDISATVKVYKSRGESGNEPPGYVWIDGATSSRINIKVYQYWSNTTHTGTRHAGSLTAGQYWYISGFSAQCLLAGDKDIVLFSTNIGISVNASYHFAFGHLNARFDNSLSTTAQGTAGTAGTLTVASTAGLGVGKYIQIVEDGVAGCDRLLVTEMVDSTTIKVSALPRTYGSSGTAYLGCPASTFGACVAGGQASDTYWYPASSYADKGTASTASYYLISNISPISAAITEFSKKVILSPFLVYADSATYGIACGFVGGNIGYAYNPYGGALIRNNDDSFPRAGSVTSGLGDKLSDLTQNWVVNSQSGRFIVILGGVGAGDVKKISSNTSNELTLQSSWVAPPDGSSDYKIADEVWLSVPNVFSTTYFFVKITDTKIPA